MSFWSDAVIRPHDTLDVVEEGGNPGVEARGGAGTADARRDHALDVVDAIGDVQLLDERAAGVALAGVLLLLPVAGAHLRLDDAHFEGPGGGGLVGERLVALVQRNQFQGRSQQQR